LRRQTYWNGTLRQRSLAERLVATCSAVAFCLLCVAVAPAVADVSDLRINEILADNEATIADEFDEYDDWIEILNTGATPVPLGGLFLTDSSSNTTMWMFPDTLLAPGGYLIIWADDDGGQGPLHTTFKLSAHGEFIGLYDSLAEGNGVIDSTSFGRQYPDIAFGRSPDGAPGFGYLIPTPGYANGGFINTPPVISATSHYPVLPREGSQVTVSAVIEDDFVLATTSLYYSTGGGFTEVPLHDDGAHNDGASGDMLYGGFIPGQSEGTNVTYFVYATDDSSAVTTDPPDAPTSTYTYEVGAYMLPPLYINEFMASNATTIADEAAEYDDWVEIYNAGPDAIDMAGFHLSDDPSDPQKFLFPSVMIEAGGWLLIWCDNDLDQGPLHAPFKLSAGGEFIGLYDRAEYSYYSIDSLTFAAQVTDVSFGREYDGDPIWQSFLIPTPGYSNQSSSVDDQVRLEPSRLALATIQHDVLHLTFSRPGAQPVRCELFDTSGRQALVSTVTAPAGEMTMRLNTGHLASGAYFLRLRSGFAEETARLLLIR
jgi:Lamin Tail Domain